MAIRLLPLLAAVVALSAGALPAALCLMPRAAGGAAEEEGADGEPLPLDGAIVHRPPHAADREALRALPEAVVVVPAAPAAPRALAGAFADAAAAQGESPADVPAGTRPVLLSTGPALDGPDRVAVRRLTLRGGRVELEVIHTAVRAGGAQLRRNVRWRPLVQVPLTTRRPLPAGRYEVRAVWRAVESVPDGKPPDQPGRVQEAAFRVVN